MHAAMEGGDNDEMKWWALSPALMWAELTGSPGVSLEEIFTGGKSHMFCL